MANSRFNRRNFAKRMILGAAAIPIGTAAAAASRADEPTEAEPAKADKPPENRDSARPISEGDLLLAIVMRRYTSEHLDAATLRSIRIEIARNFERSRQLDSYPLKNSDAPAFLFAAHDSTTG